jgi:hypothetical protein
MAITWLAHVARLLPLIFGAVHAVEALAGAKRGKDKQDAAIVALRAMVGAVEAGVDRDLLNDAEVERAVRATIDAYVALQNVIAGKRQTQPLAGTQ